MFGCVCTDSIPSSSLLEAGHVQLSLAEGITFAETETNTKVDHKVHPSSYCVLISAAD